jgi:hypothetical protein
LTQKIGNKNETRTSFVFFLQIGIQEKQQFSYQQLRKDSLYKGLFIDFSFQTILIDTPHFLRSDLCRKVFFGKFEGY